MGEHFTESKLFQGINTAADLALLCAAGAAAWYPPLLMILPGAYGFFAAKLYQPLFFRYIRVTNAEPLSENDC